MPIDGFSRTQRCKFENVNKNLPPLEFHWNYLWNWWNHSTDSSTEFSGFWLFLYVARRSAVNKRLFKVTPTSHRTIPRTRNSFSCPLPCLLAFFHFFLYFSPSWLPPSVSLCSQFLPPSLTILVFSLISSDLLWWLLTSLPVSQFRPLWLGGFCSGHERVLRG